MSESLKLLGTHQPKLTCLQESGMHELLSASLSHACKAAFELRKGSKKPFQ